MEKKRINKRIQEKGYYDNRFLRKWLSQQPIIKDRRVSY